MSAVIFESYPWKKDLLRWKKILVKYNKPWRFHISDEKTYTMIEKAIFYTAFIVRKLIDCNGKMSDEADDYTITIESFAPLKQVDVMHRWPENDSHDWEHGQCMKVNGKKVCNWLIHSYIFVLEHDEKEKAVAFYVSSDYDRNKAVYRIEISEWLKYIIYIATDDVISISMHIDKRKGDYVFTRKERSP